MEAHEPWRSPSPRGRGQGGASGLAAVPSPRSRRKGGQSLFVPGGGCETASLGSAPLCRPCRLVHQPGVGDLGDFPLRRAPQPLGTTLPDPTFSGNTSPLPPTARPGQRAAGKEIGREGIGREGDAVPGATGWGEELCDSQPAADSATPKGAHPHPKRRPLCTPGPAAPS